MKKMLYLLLMLLTCASIVEAATIDIMYTAPIAHYDRNYYSDNQEFNIFPIADYYLLDDGTTWESGAGSGRIIKSNVLSVQVDNNIITYIFSKPIDNILFQNTDYNGGNYSSQGTLGAIGSLIITAQLGDTTATMSGYAKILSNTETYYGEPRFKYYSADVGDLVYFEVNYILRDGVIFNQDLFNTDFSYYLSGYVDFTNIKFKPIPSNILLLLLS